MSIVHKLTVTVAGVALCFGLANCGGGSKSSGGSSAAPGTVVQNPDPNIDTYFVVETNFGGDAANMRVLRAMWGRLVDIYSREAGGDVLRFAEFLIGDDIATDGLDFELSRNPVTGKESLVILHALGTSGFTTALVRAESGLQPFLIKSLDPSTLPPFTAVPRNGAMSVVFSDLLNDGGDPNDPTWPGTVTAANVKLRIGYPPSSAFEARVFPDANHGDIAGGQFHSTRVIIDMTVSQFEANPANLPLNGIGLPEAVNTAQPNAALRIPTKVSPANQQFSVLSNLDGKPVAFTGNGPTDPVSPTLDVVRAFRSGGRTSITGDVYNGFLRDNDQPRVVGSRTVQVTALNVSTTPFLASYTYGTAGAVCAVQAKKGTVIDFGSVVVQATLDGPLPVLGTVNGLPIEVIWKQDPTLSDAAALMALGANPQGELRAAWDIALGAPPECFVKISPNPGVAPAALVSNTATVEISFSEPIDPESVRAYETLGINYGANQTTPPTVFRQRVVAEIFPSLDYSSFVIDPAVPLKHVAAGAETYIVNVTAGATGITDLAGNPLAAPLQTGGTTPQPPRFTLDPGETAVDSGGFSMSFAAADEDNNGTPELRGQLIYEPGHSRITGRAVSRFSAVVNTDEPTINLLAQTFGTGALQVPLVRYGSRVQALWRYHDMGFTLMEVEDPNVMPPVFFFRDAYYNLDVEGLNWAPASGTAPLLDNYPRFQIGLSHSKFLPDETNVLFIDSGLAATFADNTLDQATDPLTTVHPAGLGYVIQPLDSFVATTTTPTRMAPWPLNRGIAPSQYSYWTWRDTAKTAVAGPNNMGVDYGITLLVGDVNSVEGVYATNLVPTIGLPLLMDFRAYPSTTSGALNALAGVFAAPTTGATIETRPFFFAQSSGGVTTNGTIVNVEPDAASDVTDTPPGGSGFLGRSQFIYFGQADFVTRVNRVHSIWLDSGAVSQFFGPLQEPSASSLDPGTQATFAFRGATFVAGSAALIANARNYDPYGDPSSQVPANFTPTFVNGDPSWKSDITQVTGAQWLQMRFSLVSNAESGVTPVLSSLGVSFIR